jgi:predicted enzyme involved in methoxymalonyl-ACP biosynthesis
MSCRVLGRGVEEYLMNHVVHQARTLNLQTIRGSYIPTQKNGMVREFYGRFGFEKTHEGPDGAADWTLETLSYNNRSVLIRPVSDKIATTTI